MHPPRFERPDSAGHHTGRGPSPLVVGFLFTALALTGSSVHAGLNPQSTGQWSQVYDWPYVDPEGTSCPGREISHAALIPAGLHAGKVLLFSWSHSYDPNPPPGQPNCLPAVSDTFWFFNPEFPEHLLELTQELESNLFCSSHSFDSAGHLVVAGGNTPGEPPYGKTYRLDPFNLGPGAYPYPPTGPGIISTSPMGPLPWITLGDLAIGHFYPTIIPSSRRELTFNDLSPITGGAHIVLGGPHAPSFSNPSSTSENDVWEILPYGGAVWDWPLLAPAPGSLLDPTPPANHERYTLHAGQGQPLPIPRLDSYPRAVQLSNGHIYITGDVDTYTNHQGEAPPEAAWVKKPRDLLLNITDWQLHSAQPDVERYYGDMVLLHTRLLKDRVIVFGGSRKVLNPQNMLFGEALKSVSELVTGVAGDTQNWEWESRADMAKERVFLNAVVTPAGQILLMQGSQHDYHRPGGTGGHQGQCPVPNFAPELYDPGDDPFSSQDPPLPLAESTTPPTYDFPTPRLYHFVAVLLRDGRVLVAGGQLGANYTPDTCPDGPDWPLPQTTGEIFSPPYLFKGYRPFFAAQPPNQVQLSSDAGIQTFQIEAALGDADHKIVAVTLLRPGTVTHHFDNDQRFIELEFVETQVNGQRVTLEVRSPDETLAPPGYYMIFVLEAPALTSPRGDWVPSVGEFLRFL